MVPRLIRKVYSAFGTQTLAVFPAHRLERQGGYHCVPQHRFKIDRIVLDPTLLIFFLFKEFRGRLLVEEKFLHIDFEVILERLQAAGALTCHFNKYVTRNKNTFMNGLKTEFQIQFGSRNRANERGAKIFRHRYTLFELPHTAWAAPKLPYTNGEGRAMAGLGAQRGFANENSCKNI
ncbi:hypothetical protein ABIB48_002705 [Arthrobacter sp. UYCu511]